MRIMQTTGKSKPVDESYAAVRDGGAGVIDLSSRGRLLVSGSEAVQFLNGLITNDMKTLPVNSWMPAAFANVQGRLLAVVRVIHRDDGFLIDTETATRDVVRKLIERFTLAGDFHVSDLSEDTIQLSVQGASAAKILSKVMGEVIGEDLSALGRAAVAGISRQNESITIVRATHSAEDGFDLFMNSADGNSLREALREAGAQMISDDIEETLRIEAGIPLYGVDMDETNVVTETNLDETVSFNKGCYVGQEIIVRIKHRGHVAKKLTGITLDGEMPIERDAKVLSIDGKEVGRVTSSTLSPRLGRRIALGYVKYDYLAPDTEVRINDVPAKVSELPFVRGSWY
jgi:folate-binding protein YgfZ